jgi:predicted nucleotidyltransferase
MYTIDDIIKKTNIHPLRIKNIYCFGSRVYGTFEDYSDWDYIVVASTMQEHTELKPEHDLMNVHVITPDIFKKRLENHEIQPLECVFVPNEFKLLEKIDYLKNFKFNKNIIKNRSYGESFTAWKRAKSRFEEGDQYRGLKSIYHGLRILDFAIQICENNKIIDYSSMNYIWDEIKDTEEDDYYYYKKKYFPLKIKLEKKLRNI